MKIRVKAKEKNGLVDAKLLIKHPMETGRRKDKDGNLIPAKHLTTITIDYKGETVFDAHMGTGVSKDPYLSVSFKGVKGESFEISAADNTGESAKKTVEIK
ncbi:MAG: sulfur-oxidizing protein SoxZ [Polaribacter sp.]|jgi:sulfur-oxidizing protein SoxZ